MKIAITGINSGLGKILVPKLQKDPEIKKIIGIDITEYNGNRDKIEFIKMDIRDYDGLKSVLKDVDVLIHLAFIVISNNLPSLNEIYDININGSIRVFKASIRNNIRKIIHISSQAAYGHVPEVPDIVTEEDPLLGLRTTNFYYSHTKALLEKYLDKLEQKYNILVTRFRPPIIVGNHFSVNFQSLKFISKIVFIPDTKKPTLIQFIHEDDLTDAIILAIKNDYPGVFNIAAEPIDYYKYIKQKYQIKNNILIPKCIINFLIISSKIVKPLSKYIGWIQAALYNSKLNTDKIRNVFNWTPRFSTQDCIDEIFHDKR
ncbi:MAG: NAD-dependent epimerase/dehydratase family protein [Candidatus Helarchaeota archaeon]